MSATITWLGEGDEPSSITWNGIEFPRGVGVEVHDQWMITKALNNAMFTVKEQRAGVMLDVLPEQRALEPPPETLPEMPQAPPLQEQLKVARRRVRGRFVKGDDNAGE